MLVADKASGPAVVQRLKGENEAGELAIHYRDQRVGFRELNFCSAGREKERCPFPHPTPQPFSRGQSSLEKRLFRQSKRWLFRSCVKPKPGGHLWYDTVEIMHGNNALTFLGMFEKVARLRSALLRDRICLDEFVKF